MARRAPAPRPAAVVKVLPPDSIIMRCGYRSDEAWRREIGLALAAGRRVRAVDGAGRVVDPKTAAHAGA